MPNVFRVVLDSNVFSPTQFSVLRHSPFAALCASRRVQAIYPNVAVEEVLHSYSSEVKRSHLVTDWLPMILATAPHQCDDQVSIFRKELVQGLGPRASIYMPGSRSRRVRDHIAQIPPDGSWELMGETKVEREEADAKRTARREASKEMRLEVARRKKLLGLKVTPNSIPETFTPGREELVEFMGRALVQKIVRSSRWPTIFSMWRRRKDYYPFFTQFAEDVVFQEVHFMTNQDSSIDINAQADLEILAHLLRADAIVSNETGFLKKAFEAIWKPRGKLLLTSDEFARHLQRMA